MNSFAENLKELTKSLILNVMTFLARPLYFQTEAGPLLVVAPHPDDETLGCGGVIARARAAGQRVRIVIVTDGSASTLSEKMPPPVLALHRQTEMFKATEILGVPATDIVFLSFQDGATESQADKIAQDIAAQIWLCAPALILCPCETDEHPDHRLVAECINYLIGQKKISCSVYAYPMWTNPRRSFFTLLDIFKKKNLVKIPTRPFLETKKKAFAAYRSQTENLTGENSWTNLNPAFVARKLGPYELFFQILKK